MKKNKSISMYLSALALSTLYAMPSAFAVPTLQLNIVGGTYDLGTQTIVATTDSFTLQAFLILDNETSLADTFYLSAAIAPQVESPTNLGSFKIDSTTVDVTSDMVYGVAPIDTLQGHDGQDLGQHGIFPTYFQQFAFTFNAGDFGQAFNTQDFAGQDIAAWTSGDKMYYHEVTIDTSFLDSAYSVHFDLYNTQTGRPAETDVDIKAFAPFSHDAQSGPGGGKEPPITIPEPTTLALLGLGLLGFGATRRVKKIS